MICNPKRFKTSNYLLFQSKSSFDFNIKPRVLVCVRYSTFFLSLLNLFFCNISRNHLAIFLYSRLVKQPLPAKRSVAFSTHPEEKLVNIFQQKYHLSKSNQFSNKTLIPFRFNLVAWHNEIAFCLHEFRLIQRLNRFFSFDDKWVSFLIAFCSGFQEHYSNGWNAFVAVVYHFGDCNWGEFEVHRSFMGCLKVLNFSWHLKSDLKL